MKGGGLVWLGAMTQRLREVVARGRGRLRARKASDKRPPIRRAWHPACRNLESFGTDRLSLGKGMLPKSALQYHGRGKAEGASTTVEGVERQQGLRTPPPHSIC